MSHPPHHPPGGYPPPQYGEQTYEQVSPRNKPKKRVFRWVFLAVQLLFVAWIVSGLSSTSTEDCGSLSQEACEAATGVGAGIGVFIILVLWVIVDFILAISYLIFRKK